MKTTLSIILLCVVFSLNAQMSSNEYKRKVITHTIILDATITFAVMAEAYGDARYDMGFKKNGKVWQATSLGALVCVLPALTYQFGKDDRWIWVKVPAKYITARFGLFNPTYNLSRDLPFFYQGTTSYWDKAYNPQESIDILFSSVALGFSFYLPIN